MIVFTMKMKVEADRWSDEEEKKAFIKNAEIIVNEGLARMTVPDWKVTITDIKEE